MRTKPSHSSSPVPGSDAGSYQDNSRGGTLTASLRSPGRIAAADGGDELSGENLAAAASSLRTPRGRGRSWLIRGLTGLAGVATAVGLLAAPAGATVAPTPIAHSYSWSNCTVTVGDKSNPNRYAQADTQVTCSSRHNIDVQALLYRWNGRSWVLVETSPVLPWNNAYRADDWTAAYACGGGAYFLTVGYVSLDGSSWYSFDSNVNASPYDPGGC
jgi:hypothetical protein